MSNENEKLCAEVIHLRTELAQAWKQALLSSQRFNQAQAELNACRARDVQAMVGRWWVSREEYNAVIQERDEALVGLRRLEDRK